MSAAEFIPWPKTPRLNKDMVVTEKIDGTNACINVHAVEGSETIVVAQSRKRIITPEDDNFGFATWVSDNAQALVETLGAGRHYGEWWGSGIQRNYGFTNGERFFSLFNTGKWEGVDLSAVPNLRVVPVLMQHTFDTQVVEASLQNLLDEGSVAAPGFLNPEGVCVFHVAANKVFKLTNDPLPKSMRGEA